MNIGQMVSTTVIAACMVGVGLGCSGDKKAEVPKDLNQPLPPPPVGSGGAGKAAKKPQEPNTKAD